MEAAKWNQKEIEQVISALKQHPLKKKMDIFHVFQSLNISENEHTLLYNYLREKEYLSYSRRKPVGYLVSTNRNHTEHTRDASNKIGECSVEPMDERQLLLQKKVPDRLKKSEQQIDQILKEREEVRTAIKQQNWAKCPRCSGKMNVRTIRCGPGRMVQISVCTICNFNIPLL